MRLVTLGAVALSLTTSACGKKPADPVVTPPAAEVAAPVAEDAAPASADAAATAPPAEDVAAAHAADAAAPSADVAAAPDAAANATADAGVAAAPEIDPLTAQAKALLDTWLAAQNKADYEAYAGLYAPRFTGIKRSGPRERKYAHDGWLADRKRMFKSAMTVTADDVQIATISDSVIVSFVQTWASGSYQDKGRKQLVLVPKGEALVIAREEMLASEIQAGDAAPKAVDPTLFTLLVPIAEGEANAVIPAIPVDDWANGAPTLVRMDMPTIVTRTVDVAKLPPDLQAWMGKQLTTDEGCTGAVDRLMLVGRFQPHFGTVQGWAGEGDGPKLSDVAIAADAWASGGISVELVARIAGCSDGLWARVQDKPAPAKFSATEPDAKRAASALAEFRKLAGWKAIQADAKLPDSGVDTATWDVFDGSAPQVSSWTDGTRTFVQVTASAGAGCGSFGAAFGAIFEVTKGDTFVLLTDPEGGPSEPIGGVVDLDGDGEIEFVRKQGLIQRVGPVWKQTLDVTPPYYDCPC